MIKTISVPTRLTVLTVMILVLSAFSVFGILEISKGAKFHELNSLHLKFNHLFFDEVLKFEANGNLPTQTIEQYLKDIRKQPEGCLEVAGWFERFFMKLVGTYRAIELCRNDIALAEKTLAEIHRYKQGDLSSSDLSALLNTAKDQFRQNFVEFEPLVSITVQVMTTLLIITVISTSLLVITIGIGINKSVGKDYKKLVQTQKSLETVNNRYELVSKSARVGIWDWADVSDDVEYWSPRFYQLLGYYNQEIDANITNFYSLIHPDDLEATQQLVQKHFNQQAEFDIEHRLKTKSGEFKWFRSMAEASRDAQGNPIRLVGSIQDIHEKKVMEATLLNLNERLVLALDASRVGIWDWDVIKNELVWDKQMYHLYDIKPEDFGSAYEAWDNTLHSEDSERANAEIELALEGKKKFDTEFRIVCPNNDIRYIRSLASVIRNKSGEPLRMLGVNWDITKEKNDEAKLQKLNDDLAQFAYRTSHDLKSPLASIGGLAGFVIQDIEEEDFTDVKQHVELIKLQADKLRTLVTDILELARADFDESETEVIHLPELLNEIKSDLADQLEEKNITVKDTIQVSKPIALQLTRLRQIIYNLFSNAVKYSDPLKEQKYISLFFREENDILKIIIEDNGLGFPEESSPDIFKMFKRFHPNVATGSGLGLSIIKKHTDRMKGEIVLESGNNTTRFVLKFYNCWGE